MQNMRSRPTSAPAPTTPLCGQTLYYMFLFFVFYGSHFVVSECVMSLLDRLNKSIKLFCNYFNIYASKSLRVHFRFENVIAY